MIRIEHSVMIPGPVDEVFGYAADYRKWPDWFVGLSDVRATTDIHIGTGARYSYTVRMISVPARVETEIHDFAENTGWTGVGVKGLPHRTRWVFESTDEGTRFTYGLEGWVPVPVVGFVFDVCMRPVWNRIVEKSLQNLRQHFLEKLGGGSL